MSGGPGAQVEKTNGGFNPVSWGITFSYTQGKPIRSHNSLQSQPLEVISGAKFIHFVPSLHLPDF